MNANARILCIGIATVLSVLTVACKGQLIKDNASTLVTQGKLVTEAIAGANNIANLADFSKKQARAAAKGSNCPLGMGNGPDTSPIFLRDDRPAGISDPRFERLAQGVNQPGGGSASQLPGCQQLFKCERGSRDPKCHTTCYSEPEAKCIALISKSIQERAQADTPKGSIVPATLPIRNEAQDLQSKLSATQMAPSRTYSDIALAMGVNSFTAYLSALSVLADDKPKDISPIADTFTTRESDLYAKIKAINVYEIPADVQSAQTKISSITKVSDTLISDVAKAARTEEQGKKVAVLVKTDVNFDTFVREAQTLAEGAVSDAQGFDDSATLVREAAYRERYDEKSASTYDRLQITENFDELSASYRDRTTARAELKAKIPELFKQMDLTRMSLIQLIDDPTSEQKRAIVNATVDNIVKITSDIYDLYNVFK